MQYKVERRYEWLSQKGKTWTNWFLDDSGPFTKEEGEAYIKNKKSDLKDIIRITKLDHEMRLSEITE